MPRNLIFFCIFLTSIFLLAGCAGKAENKQNPLPTYLCPDGKVVIDVADCQKIEQQKIPEKGIEPEYGKEQCPEGMGKDEQGRCISCPESCDDGNICTQDVCDSSTNYSCKHIGLNDVECGAGMVCIEGVCKAIESKQNREAAIDFLYDESKNFVSTINNKRIEVYSVKSKLENDRRLELIAEACVKELLLQNSSDLTLCYNKYGSFKELLAEVGFYGNRFYYLSEANKSSKNISQDLYRNLSKKELALLINKSVNHPGLDMPFILEYIGASVGCLDDRCLLLAIAAGNTLVSRNKYDNWWVYEENFLPTHDGRYVPQKYTLRILDASDFSPAWCKIFIYNLTNSTLRQIDGHFWWSDQWEYANHGKAYERRVEWTDYSSELLPHPSKIYYWCYSTKEVEKGELCGSKKRDKVEFVREFLEDKGKYDEAYVLKILSLKEQQRNTTRNFSILDYINEKRAGNNLSKINYSESLSIIARSCMQEYLRNFDWKDCYEKVFWNTTIDNAIGARGMFGEWQYNYNLINEVNDEAYLMDTVKLPGFEKELYYGDMAKNAEYFGHGLACEGGVCASMLMWGSNKKTEELRNVRKYCGFANYDCSYGLLLMRSYVKGCGKIDYLYMPNISLRFNSTAPAKYYFYKNKERWMEIWDDAGGPKPGYDIWIGEEKKEHNITLPPGIWTITYWPKIKSVEDSENLTIEITFFPKIKVK